MGGVAHRGAGSFDDIVLAVGDDLIGHQVKTSRTPTVFRLETLMLGADALWSAILEGLHALAVLEPTSRPAVVYACDDRPSENDQLGDTPGSTSAALIDLHRRHATDWEWADWMVTPFAPFLRKLRTAGALDDAAFVTAWRAITFQPDGAGRLAGAAERTPQDRRRLEKLAGLLPILAADRSDRDRWEITELRSRLEWSDAFKPRHGHRFPAAAFYEENDRAREMIAAALSSTSRGYIALVGPPGSGKSTLLAAGVLDAERMRTVRYLAFVPGDGQSLGRAEAHDFLHDLITSLKQQGLGAAIMPGQTIAELRDQFQALLVEAGERFSQDDVRTLIIVDGLDHVPREERYELSLLTALPPPDAVPDGVMFLLGTQRVDLVDIPPAVQRQAGADGRRLDIPPLTREAVIGMAAAADLPEDVDRADLHAQGGGHPLSTRYLIEGLLARPDEGSRRAWFQTAPSYTGEVDHFYASAWGGLRGQTDARKALGYIALAEGPLRQSALEALVGRDAVDATWEAAHHLLTVGPNGDLAVFHNSFRLFLQGRTLERLGRPDDALKRERYADLGAMARATEHDDPQRWMELRYLARAENDEAVLGLAIPDRFRDQFVHGRDPQDIQDDIGLAFRAAGRLRRGEALLPLLFARHEIALRSEAIGPEMVDAYLALGDRDAARGLLKADGPTLTDDVRYRVIDADLRAGDMIAAKAAFETVEPLDQLLGAEPVSDMPWDDQLPDWAQRVLAFRPVPQVLRALDRLVAPAETFRTVDLDELRWRLKLAALEGELRRRPERDPETLRVELGLPDTDRAVAQLFGATAARSHGQTAEAAARIDAALSAGTILENDERLQLAGMARKLSRPDLVERALAGLPPPTFQPSNLRDPDDLNLQIDAVLNHAEARAALGWTRERGAPHEKPFLATLQRRLEDLGMALGELERGDLDATSAVAGFRECLTFLSSHNAKDPHDHDRHRLDGAMDRIVARIVTASARSGDVHLRRILADLDEAPDGNWRLRQPDVRRAYALTAFRFDGDIQAARKRTAYVSGGERTPEAQMAEAASSARVLISLGLAEEARDLLISMHEEGLGLSRPAKKDPQYFVWIELLEEACKADPASREARLNFMMRFISGLSDNEAYDLGGRTLPAVLTEGAQTRWPFALAVADRAARLGDLSWSRMIGSIGRGVACAQPDLSLAASTIVGRLACLFTDDHDRDPFDGLIEVALEPLLYDVASQIMDIVETDAADGVRLKFLEAACDAARDRGLEPGRDRLARWQSELPRPSSGSSPEDPFFHTRSLAEIAALLEDPTTTRIWNASRAFTRTAPREGYEAARVFVERYPELRDHRGVLKALADLAIAEDRLGDAGGLRDALSAMAANTPYDDGWAGGARLLAAEIDAALRGDDARAETFDALCGDLAAGRAWPARLLQYLVDVLKVIAPAPSWPDAWSALEAHLAVFREFPQGEVLPVAPDTSADVDGVVVLADLLHRSLALGPIDLTDQVRLALLEISEQEAGPPIVACLVDRLLGGPDDDPLTGAQIAWSHRDLDAVRTLIVPRLPALVRDRDFGVRRVAEALSLDWDLPIPHPQPNATIPADISGLSAADLSEFGDQIWPIMDHLRATAKASGGHPVELGRRAAAILAELADPPTDDMEARAAGRAAHLGVHGPQVRWTARAAYLAHRRLLTELVDAGQIDPDHAARLSDQSGVDARLDHDRRVEPRPASLPRPAFGDPYRDEHYQAWLDQIDDDAAAPSIAGWVILGGWSRHRSIKRSGEQCAEQVYGLPAGEDFDDAIRALPAMRLELDFELEVRPGRRALIRRLSGPVFWDREVSLGLCPLLAQELGWMVGARDPTRFADPQGVLQARTLSWRDSGCTGRIDGEAVLREGQLVIATAAAAEAIHGLVAVDPGRRAWRTVKRDGALTVTSAVSPRPGD